MRNRKTFLRLFGIFVALLCLQTGAKAANNSSLSLEHVTFHKGATQEEGYYQLNADSEEGSIRLLNQDYRQLTVTGYTYFASFSSVLGNSPIRGFSPLLGTSMDYTPLRFDTKRHLLIARDGTEGFCLYPDRAAAHGTGYALFSLNGIDDGMFSSLPTYGVCLQYSTDREGTRFQMLPLLPNQFKANIHHFLDSRPVYQETYTANIPAEAIWLRISLSCAKQLQGPDGQMFANSDEQPARIASICCDEKVMLPQESPLPSTPPNSTSGPDSSTSSDPSSSPPEASETPDSSVGTSSAPGSSSSDTGGGISNPEQPGENLVPVSPSGSMPQDEETLENPPVRPARGRLTKEPVHYSAAAPSKSLSEAPAAVVDPAPISGSAQDSTSLQPAEDLEAIASQEACPDKADTAEDTGKPVEEETAITTNNLDNTASDPPQPAATQAMPLPEPAPQNTTRFSPAVLILYLALIAGTAAFVGMRIGIQKGRREGESSQTLE